MSQRTESNEYDVLSALQTMGVAPRALALYARGAAPVPYAQRLPTAAERRRQLHAVRERLLAQLAVVTPHKWEGARPPHVPACLPPFPKAHTYCATLAPVAPVPLSARLRRFAKQQQSVESTLVAIYARSGRRAPHTDYATAMSVVPSPQRRRNGGGSGGGATTTDPAQRTSTAALFAAAADAAASGGGANSAASATTGASTSGETSVVLPTTASLMTREGAPEAARQEIEAKMKRFDTRRDVSDDEDDQPVPAVPAAPVGVIPAADALAAVPMQSAVPMQGVVPVPVPGAVPVPIVPGVVPIVPPGAMAAPLPLPTPGAPLVPGVPLPPGLGPQ